MDIRQFLRSLIYDLHRPQQTSIEVRDRAQIARFVANPNNTFLVSFPRTGSHWLRMLMELYFGRPSLVRVFYYPGRKDYLSLHTHDLEMDVERVNVISLYRNPVDTIYSQLRYHKEDSNHLERIVYWSNLYGRHLDKWLYQETFTEKKSIIRYENLKNNMSEEFNKICNHFNYALDDAFLKGIAARVSKRNVKKKTPHDPQAVNLSRRYEDDKNIFCDKHRELIWQVLLRNRKYLKNAFRSTNPDHSSG